MAGAVSCKAAEILYKQSPDTSNCKEPEKRHWWEDLLDVNDVSNWLILADLNDAIENDSE